MPAKSTAPRHHQLAVNAAVAGLVLLASTAGWAFAQTPSPMPNMPESESPPALTHEQMHQMMDAIHGEGTSQRMYEAMGVEADAMMEQCAAKMNMMPLPPILAPRGRT